MCSLRGGRLAVCLAAVCMSCFPLATLGTSNPVTEALEDSKKVGWIGAVRFYEGVSPWLWYRYVWSDKVVKVSCPFKGYQVHAAPTAMGLQDAWDSNRPSACSFIRSLRSDNCQVVMSPFQDMYVAIARPQRAWSAFQDAQKCTFSVREELSLWRPVAGALGLALFTHADVMSQSVAFRLCTGSVTFALLSVLVLAYFLYRSIPNRRLLVGVGTAIAFSPVALKHALNVWLPRTLDLTYNQVFLAYMLFSGLIGLALTYYYDNPGNAKLVKILEVSMRLLGTLLAYSQSASSEIALAIVVLMVSAYGMRKLGFAQRLLRGVRPVTLDTAMKALRFAAQGDIPPGAVVKDEAVSHPVVGYVTDEEDDVEPPVCISRSPYMEGATPRSSGRKRFSSTKIVPSPSRLGKTKTWSEIDGHLAGDSSPFTRSRGPVPEERNTPRAAAPVSTAQESPLVQRGLILNMQTGRAIQIGKGTYNQLKSAGYIEDRTAGTITPPPNKR